MGKHFLITLLMLTAIISSNQAQYYYKDIVTNKQLLAEKSVLRQQGIRNILVHSFEGDKEPSTGFYCEKKISKDYKRIETYTKSNITSKSLLTAFYNEKDQIISSRDSSEISVNTTQYQYDERGNVAIIISTSHSNDDDFTTTLIEKRQYSYNARGIPVKMFRTKDQKDTATIIFIADENGNITDEIDLGKNGKHYYYYYNDKNRLTDIVKYNVVKNKLLPDFIFEYNSVGQVTQMVSIEEGANSDYYTWKYVYNDGLRIIEKCFSKENILLGYFEYEYD